MWSSVLLKSPRALPASSFKYTPSSFGFSPPRLLPSLPSLPVFSGTFLPGVKRFYSEPSLLDLVKILRKDTNAGISDCRQALVECDRDIDKAKQWLLKKSKNIAAKKSDRAAQEGGISVALEDNRGVIIELNCETDFAAKEANFTHVGRNIAAIILQAAKSGSELSNVLNLPCAITVAGINVKTIAESIEALAGILKENVKLKRVTVLPTKPSPNSQFKSYIHSPLDSIKPPIGRIGVILQYSTSSPVDTSLEPTLSKLLHNLCVQLATQPPTYLYPSQVPADKPKKPTSEDLEYEMVFIQQEYLFGSGTVSDAIKDFENKSKHKLHLEDFRRWMVCEGEEKVEGNLANEVEELLKSPK